jgi:hypothetical protein
MSGISSCIDAIKLINSDKQTPDDEDARPPAQGLHAQRPADMTSRRRMRSLAAVAHPQRST